MKAGPQRVRHPRTWFWLPIVLCACAPEPARFPDFAGATQVVIVGGGGGDTLAVIGDSSRVAAIARFADRRNSAWKVPWSGVPVPRITAGFWRGKEYLGSFGAGPELFETQRAGTFASRRATAEEVRAFVNELGVAARTPPKRSPPASNHASVTGRETFSIPSRDDGAALNLSRVSNDYFAAELRSRGLVANAGVSSYLTTGLGAFFAELARDWRGWHGTREWSSFEYELEIRAESDRTGHTYLDVSLHDGSPPRWTARARLVIEAGQLDALAAAAAAFEQSMAPPGP